MVWFSHNIKKEKIYNNVVKPQKATSSFKWISSGHIDRCNWYSVVVVDPHTRTQINVGMWGVAKPHVIDIESEGCGVWHGGVLFVREL